MPKLIRILLGIVAVVVGAMAAILLFVDPNDYKDEIIQEVNNATGRTLVINGSMGLSVFPWVALEVNDVSLSNAEGFGEQAFVAIDRAEVRVKLLPLLASQIEVGTVVLHGMKLDLARNAHGISNWDDLAGGGEGATESTGGPSQPPAIAALVIGGLDVRDASVRWSDSGAGQIIQFSEFNLTTDAITLDQAVSFELGVKLSSTAPPLDGIVGLSGEVVVDASLQELTLDGLALAVNGFTVRSNLEVSNLTAGPVIRGDVSIPDFSVKELLKSLGQAVPETADPAALSRVGLQATLAATGSSVRLSDLILKLDDTTLQGYLEVSDFATAATRFSLGVDEIDVDRYLPPASEQPPAASPAEAAAGVVLLPVELIRGLRINGDLEIGKLKVSGMRAAGVKVAVVAKEGWVKITQSIDTLYGGTYNAEVVVNAKGKTPVLKLNESLSGVQIGPLLIDAAAKDVIEGLADINANLTARGNQIDALKKTLGGTLDFTFRDGALKGINVAKLIRYAEARLAGKPVAIVSEPNQTDFAEMSGTANIENGVLTNDDFLAKSPLLRISGKGTADIAKETLDYNVRTNVVGTMTGQDGKTLDKLHGIVIPLRIKGPFSDPSVKVDLKQALTKAQKQKLEEKTDELKGKLKRKFGDKLKNLF
ncbi:MAG TPA: AsmA family protein [Chromatiales bacterium]|jgi:AsmA protein|nr:AsmA family protein [Chromatiaceae bacterium]HIO55276.1 AsmA family protein [Chromatiales bacterium]